LFFEPREGADATPELRALALRDRTSEWKSPISGNGTAERAGSAQRHPEPVRRSGHDDRVG